MGSQLGVFVGEKKKLLAKAKVVFGKDVEGFEFLLRFWICL